MADAKTLIVILTFLLTIVFIIWRPKGVNEAIPVSAGAAILLLTGIVPLTSLRMIAETVSGAAITILSTIIMSIVLDSIGFFDGRPLILLNTREDRAFGYFAT